MPIGQELSQKDRFLNRRRVFGIFFIILAGVLAFFAIRTAGHMDRYWAAKDTIVAGQAITPAQLVAVEANPGNSARRYFKADKVPSLRATQTIGAGELLARSSVTDAPVEVKQLVIRLSSPLPGGVEKGDYLEIWQLPEESSERLSQRSLPRSATKISAQAVFISQKKSATVTASEETAIEVLVNEPDLEAILGAVGKKLSLVAIPVAS